MCYPRSLHLLSTLHDKMSCDANYLVDRVREFAQNRKVKAAIRCRIIICDIDPSWNILIFNLYLGFCESYKNINYRFVFNELGSIN